LRLTRPSGSRFGRFRSARSRRRRCSIKLDPAVERKFLEARLKKHWPFDEAWINGDCAVPGVQSLDGLFKRLLEKEER
jgi:hypothetical protein